MYTAEGTIEVPLEEFWAWLEKNYSPRGEIYFGVPRVNQGNSTIEINFAVGTTNHPLGWAIKPEVLGEWTELK